MNTANTVVYVTSNEIKFQVALQALQNSRIALERKSLNTPEIQSTSVKEIAEWSAIYQLHRGEIATKAGRRNGTSIDQILIPEGHSKPISEIPANEMIVYWSNTTVWQELELYIEGLAHGG